MTPCPHYREPKDCPRWQPEQCLHPKACCGNCGAGCCPEHYSALWIERFRLELAKRDLKNG